MKALNYLKDKGRFIIAFVICCLKNHDFKFIEKLSDQSMKIYCKRCKKYYAVNMHIGAIIPYTEKVEEFYKSFSNCI